MPPHGLLQYQLTKAATVATPYSALYVRPASALLIVYLCVWGGEQARE